MLDQSQTCPSCRSNKYTNPHLRFMVNTCGHSLCENCVEVLFVRGSGLCVQCNTPIRKVNFRYQLFEDPLVQKEVEIRKKILSDFNKREDDFDTLSEYDDYLEKIEEIIYNLMNDIDVEETKKYIEHYKKQNKDIIKKNRLRPSASMAFYEAELEREALLREQREKEDMEKLMAAKEGDNANSSAERSTFRTDNQNKHTSDHETIPATTLKRLAPPSIATGIYAPPSIDPFRARFNAPPSVQFGLQAPASSMPYPPRERVFIPPPPSAVGGGYMAPPSMMPFAPPTAGVSNTWTPGIQNTAPNAPSAYQHFRPPDTVLIPTRSRTTRNHGQNKPETPTFVYKPLELNLFGPCVPAEETVRWQNLVETYTSSVIVPLRSAHERKLHTAELESNRKTEGEEASETLPAKREALSPCGVKNIKLEDEKKPLSFGHTKIELTGAGDQAVKTTEVSETKLSPSLRGLSEQLPPGACGISPCVFLKRCLEESRCGLFL